MGRAIVLWVICFSVRLITVANPSGQEIGAYLADLAVLFPAAYLWFRFYKWTLKRDNR